jgi:uncharacterized Zn-finger protein
MQPVETIEVDAPAVGCDGGGGALGHPRVYLAIGELGRVECPYCSRIYTLKAGAKVPSPAH